MKQFILPLLISLFAGFSTLIGGFIAIRCNSNNQRTLAKSLSISAGIMLALCLVELLPEGYTYLSSVLQQPFSLLMLGFAFFLGMLTSTLLDRLIDEGQLKYHLTEERQSFKIGIIMVITLLLHNFPEGIITFVTGYENLSLGLILAVGIIMHNIPEGVAIAAPIYYATKDRKKALFYCFISGLAEPIGAIVGMVWLNQFLNPYYLGILFVFLAGVMVNVSLQELLPTSHKILGKRKSWLFCIAGFFLMFFLLNLFH